MPSSASYKITNWSFCFFIFVKFIQEATLGKKGPIVRWPWNTSWAILVTTNIGLVILCMWKERQSYLWDSLQETAMEQSCCQIGNEPWKILGKSMTLAARSASSFLLMQRATCHGVYILWRLHRVYCLNINSLSCGDPWILYHQK